MGQGPLSHSGDGANLVLHNQKSFTTLAVPCSAHSNKPITQVQLQRSFVPGTHFQLNLNFPQFLNLRWSR